MNSKLTAKEALKLIGITGIIISSVFAPNLPIAYYKLSKEWKKYKNGDIGRVVRRFHKSGLIKFSEKDNGEIVLELSDKGKLKLLKYDLDNLTLKKRYDGKMRVLIFDIPREKNQHRDIFRQKLKEMGFKSLQDSVFVSPYPCRDEVEFMTQILGIQDNVILFQVGKTELGMELKFQKSKVKDIE